MSPPTRRVNARQSPAPRAVRPPRLSCEVLEDRTVPSGWRVAGPGNMLATMTTGGDPRWAGTWSATAAPLAQATVSQFHTSSDPFPQFDYGSAFTQAWSDGPGGSLPPSGSGLMLVGLVESATPGRAAEGERMQLAAAWAGTSQGGDRSRPYWDVKVVPSPSESPDQYYAVRIDWNTLADLAGGSAVTQAHLSLGYGGASTDVLDGPLHSDRASGSQTVFAVRANDTFRLSAYLQTTAVSTDVHVVNAINFTLFLSRVPPPPPPPVTKPDVAVRSAQFLSGGSLQVTYQTANDPGPFQVGVYRSADPAFDPSDLAHPVGGPVTLTPPPSPGVATDVVTVTDPNDPLWRDDSRPYIVVVADPANRIDESDESGNVASFLPPPYSTPGQVFANVLLPEVQLPINLPKPAFSPVNLRFAPLEVGFTAQAPSVPGGLVTAQSDVGSLGISVVQPTAGVEVPLGTSTGQAALTVVGGAAPYVHWHTDRFHFEVSFPHPDIPPFVIDFGPFTMDVPLSRMGLTLAAPFDTTLRAAEAYIHRALSQQLPYISTLLGTLLIVQDPGSTDLLVTDPAGRQTGRRADGAVVSGIPFSAYLAAGPAVLVFAPQPGSYETDVRGRDPGAYALVTAAVSNLATPVGVQSFAGTLGAGETEVYATQVGPGADPVTAADPLRTLDLVPPYVGGLVAADEITNQGVANSLLQKLDHARERLAAGDAAGARSVLNAFLNEVAAQRGKKVGVPAADRLADLAEFILGALPGP